MLLPQAGVHGSLQNCTTSASLAGPCLLEPKAHPATMGPKASRKRAVIPKAGSLIVHIATGKDPAKGTYRNCKTVEKKFLKYFFRWDKVVTLAL